MDLNIMMDPRPLYPEMFHPVDDHLNITWNGFAKHHSRTARPTKYYFIDFGLSRKYKPSDAPFLEDIILGGDKSVPEYQGDAEACDPFPADVYYLGNAIRKALVEVCHVISQHNNHIADILSRNIEIFDLLPD